MIEVARSESIPYNQESLMVVNLLFKYVLIHISSCQFLFYPLAGLEDSDRFFTRFWMFNVQTEKN